MDGRDDRRYEMDGFGRFTSLPLSLRPPPDSKSPPILLFLLSDPSRFAADGRWRRRCLLLSDAIRLTLDFDLDFFSGFTWIGIATLNINDSNYSIVSNVFPLRVLIRIALYAHLPLGF
ncbi:hypothetical protein B296_00007960 [Ensete ventricosum]|uniref:Uncharacterized protein n=1 Tax=Ensete ventricosum TaxID=4639 RepID=A0A427AVB3_ENSVE|nr:hypothetical protein B296_00007960 [Ensete ventricosum]